MQDAYSANTLFASDDLKNAEIWRQAAGTFTSRSDTKLLVIRIERTPPGRPIRGNLWIDGVHLAASRRESGQ